MLIHGQEFDFSLLNANDLDRLEDALDEMTREGEAETARCERENVRLGDRLRAQARVSMRGLDKILGAGASARLGLNENDVSRLYDVLDEITQAAAAEKARYSRPAAVPQNRAQRRAETRQKDWEFRPMVWFNGQYLRLPEDEKGLPELARETMRRFYRVAVPPEEEVDAFKALVEFYTAGPQEVADRPGSSRTEELALDYVTDGSAIVAAFQQAYGIDLTRARLHWWRFKALMSNLPEETQLAKIIGFRTADPAQFQGAERERRAELKERFALPAALRKGGGRIVTLQDRNEAFAARFRR